MQINGRGIIYYLVLIAIALSTIILTPSCRSKMSKREREIQKEKERRRKEDTVLYQKALKKHMKNQGRETRKIMKQNAKEAQRYNEQKDEFFIKRWIKNSNYKRKSRQRG